MVSEKLTCAFDSFSIKQCIVCLKTKDLMYTGIASRVRIFFIIVYDYRSVSVLILHNQCHPPPAILLDDAVEHTGKVDLRWQQLEVVGKPHTITQLIG